MPRGGPAPRFAGRYKVEPEDFEVEEVPAYEPCGEGEHTWLWLEKRGIATLDLVPVLAEELGLHPREIGYAGLKDAQAVTRQWLSVEGLDEERARGLQGEGWRVLRVSRHGNKLKLGHLRGNRFALLVRDAGAEDAEAARANLEHMARHGAPNYFGEQRFGKRGANLDKGLRILHGNPKKAARAMPKRLLRIIVSAVQSEVFNRVVVRRLSSLGTLMTGDVAFLHRNGACFVSRDPASEQVRADSFEVSPSGPLPGPKMLEPEGEPAAIEQAVMDELGVTKELFGRIPFHLAPGERRPLRVPVWQPEVEAVAEGVRLGFSLPRGSYATSVLRELLTEAPWFGG